MIESLQNLAINFCISRPQETLLERIADDINQLEGPVYSHGRLKSPSYILHSTGIYLLHLRPNIYLPADLCHPLLQGILKTHDLSLLGAFSDRSRCHLTQIDIPGLKKANQSSLYHILNHPIQELNISNGVLLLETAEKIKGLANSLTVLNVYGTTSSVNKQSLAAFLESLNNLISLNISSVNWCSWDVLSSISRLEKLHWLDISDCDLDDITPITHLSSTLQHLYMYNVCKSLKNKDQLGENLSKMKALTHLDISCELRHIFPANDSTPWQLSDYVTDELLYSIASLPNLIHLDISGCIGLVSDALNCLKETPDRKRLQFLGLFGTTLDHHQDLPAEVVAGSASEAQILVALAVYGKRHNYMLRCLQRLFEVLSNEESTAPEKTLKLILAASKALLQSEDIQLELSACIFKLLRHTGAMHYEKELRQSTVLAILDMMDIHKSARIQMNCCQCLCSFPVPEELEFMSLRVCETLLKILKLYTGTSLRHIAIVLFNAIVCFTSEIKLQAVKFGAIKIILDVIQERVSSSVIDNLLENCWSALWNITDETPENCESFVNLNGMDLFIRCFAMFDDETNLSQYMMGLMGNIAEAQHIRPRLMKREYVVKFLELLDNSKYNFEINYNAAGVLSHMCSDGEEAWTLAIVSRNQCMDVVIAAIEKWDINAERNISYRSFHPFAKLMPKNDTPCAQLWAAWALANLTLVYPQKYCDLLRREGGMEILQRLIASQGTSEKARDLAKLTVAALKAHADGDQIDAS